jgi:ABC-type Fe3+ transport system permease subunit
MSENELGKALLRGEDPIDLPALTQAVLRRDRRWMWFLGIACIIAWMAVVMLPWGTILPMIARIGEYQMALNREPPPSPAEQREQSILVAQAIKLGTLATFISSVLSMFVAALCTVSLIILSRRATLRQLNVRLAEISAQLKTLPRETK